MFYSIHLLFSIFIIYDRWGIIGVTEQYILGKTENMRYLKEVELIGDHIGRICESAVNDLNCMSQSISNPPNDSRNSRIESEKE
jgi:cell division control protein 45